MSEEHGAENGKPRWHKKLVIALLLIIGVSVAARVAMHEPAPEKRSADSPLGPSSLVAGDPEQGEVQREPSTTEKVLPFVTEGGLAMLLGTMLGMATRMVAKLAVFLFALFFVGLQFMSYKGWIGDIDWSGMATWVKDFVLNISSDEGLGGIVKHKLPSAGSLALGYYLGLKRTP